MSDSDDFIEDPNFIPSDKEGDISSDADAAESSDVQNLELVQRDATEKESNKSKRKRSKLPQPTTWKCNERKQKRQKGEAYVSMRGKDIKRRGVKPKDCGKCKKKCNENFTEEERKTIFSAYWGIGDLEKQRLYINSLIVVEAKHSKRTQASESRRSKTNRYYLIKNQQKLEVCQGFFVTTLDISEGFIRGIIKKRSDQNIIESDRRGRHPPGVKRPDDNKAFIINHINKFPRVPSHYCRKDTNKEYLPGDVNLQTMYDLYAEECQELGIVTEKIWLYRQIFNTKFNISFHVPKKDVCDKCFVFDHMTLEEKSLQEEDHNMHMNRKLLARDMKNSLKKKAEKGECHLAEFDLEAVRYCPQTNAKKIFYKRRLAVYNLTVYDTAANDAYCYMWHEGVAKRGSIEVASCLWNYLQKLQNSENDVNFFSDTCGGQNRNVNMVSMWLYAVSHLNIKIINHFFFEPGHSQMECDSVHAKIETKSKNVEIFDPSGWYTLVRLSSKKEKYRVIEMDQKMFLDFNSLKNFLIKNRKTDSTGKTVNWLKIVWLQFRKTDPQTVFFKYEMDKEDFSSFSVQPMPKKRSSVRNNNNGNGSKNETPFSLNPAYHEPIPIKAAKFKNLMELCESNIVGANYHPFYNSLKPTNNLDDEENSSQEESSD